MKALSKPQRASAAKAARRYLGRVDRAQRHLQQLGLPWPGGDGLPRDVLVGIDLIMQRVRPRNRFERLALEWLDVFREAGAAMLPAKETTMQTRRNHKGASA